MSKHRNQKNGDSNSGFKIPDDMKKFAKLTMKKFKKNSGDYYDTKKELRKAYYAHIMDCLPDVTKLIVRYGHLDEVREVKFAIYEKILDEGFIKYLYKELKDDAEFEGMELFPAVIWDIIRVSNAYVQEQKEENPDFDIQAELNDIGELSKLILAKKIKKMTKNGISESLAWDSLCIIPTADILKRATAFYFRNLFGLLYEHAKTENIPFGKLIKVLLKEDKDKAVELVIFCLLERKDKITAFNDNQKKFFNDVTDWCFNVIEEFDTNVIERILKTYVEARKRDESQNKDSNRRYYISSLPEKDYPKIVKVMNRMIKRDESLSKYF